MPEDQLDISGPLSIETNESYTSPKVACDRIDCCIALPGDGCALTISYKESWLRSAQIPLSNEHHAGQVGNYVIIKKTATPLFWRIIKYHLSSYWLSIRHIVSHCVKQQD